MKEEKTKFKEAEKHEVGGKAIRTKGITLIALVVTIVVLLILARNNH